jgi:hypothetical protein
LYAQYKNIFKKQSALFDIKRFRRFNYKFLSQLTGLNKSESDYNFFMLLSITEIFKKSIFTVTSYVDDPLPHKNLVFF